ncbi:MAG TPA: plastocyanin/azurin family copper-binding protein [Thermomicrobiales bacterium]|jgi:plastocyanin
MGKQRNWKRLSRSFIPAMVLGLFIMGIGVAAAENNAAQAATVNIEVGDNFFNPTQSTINVGDTVVWTLKGARPHDVTSDDGSFVSPRRMMNGQSFSYTATKAGSFAYQCTIHTGMVATLIVQAATPTAVPNTGGGGMATSVFGQWQQLALLGIILVGGSAALVAVRRRSA